jgi:hypothetical protein
MERLGIGDYIGQGAYWHEVLSEAIENKLEKNPNIEFIVTRDFDSVSKLLSKDYYENAGTTDRTEDDYGLAGIKKLFTTLGDHVKEVRVEVTIRDLSVEGDRGRVVFDYALTMLYDVGGEERWQTARDVNQVELRREGGSWLILSGI